MLCGLGILALYFSLVASVSALVGENVNIRSATFLPPPIILFFLLLPILPLVGAIVAFPWEVKMHTTDGHVLTHQSDKRRHSTGLWVQGWARVSFPSSCCDASFLWLLRTGRRTEHTSTLQPSHFVSYPT